MKSSNRPHGRRPSKMSRLFIRFMKEEGIYTTFSNACNKRTCQPHGVINSLYYGSYVKYIRKGPRVEVDEMINRAFCWMDTDEGHEFWSALDDKWRRVLCKGFDYYDK